MTIFFTDQHTKLKNILKLLLYVAVGCVIFEILMIYLNNIPIDDAKEGLLHTLKICYIVSSIICPFAAIYIVLFTIKYYLDKRELFKHRNKKKVRIYLFDVLNFLFLGIFCLLCIYQLLR